jgi:hypothetical protein
VSSPAGSLMACPAARVVKSPDWVFCPRGRSIRGLSDSSPTWTPGHPGRDGHVGRLANLPRHGGSIGIGAGRLSHPAVRARWVQGTADAVFVGVLAFVASVVFLAILYCVIRLRVHPDE